MADRCGASSVPSASDSSGGSASGTAMTNPASAAAVHAARAGVEREPGGDLGVARERAAQPDRAVLVEQGQCDRGESAAERAGRLGRTGQREGARGVGERVEHGAERALRVAGGIGESRSGDGGAYVHPAS